MIVTVGMGLYLSAATLNQAALARAGAARLDAAGSAARSSSSIWTLVPIVGNDFHRVEIGYLGAAALLCSLLYWLYRQPLERAERPIEPGSAEEMELQLASADEAG